MTPKFRAWLKEEKRMTDVHEMTFIDGEVYLMILQASTLMKNLS